MRYISIIKSLTSGTIRMMTIVSLLLMGVHVLPAQDITEAMLEDAIKTLDNELKNRQYYIDQRQARIDSLYQRLENNPGSLPMLEALGMAYTSFYNDSALVYYTRAYDKAEELGDTARMMLYKLSRASLLPLSGYISTAVNEYQSIDTLKLSPYRLETYYDRGRQMYSYIAAFYLKYPSTKEYYVKFANECQRKLLGQLPQGTSKQLLNKGEYLYQTGNYVLAEGILKELIVDMPLTNPYYGRASHIVADIARKQGKETEYIYYLTRSALSDLINATLEVTSLQELGMLMFEHGDVARAHNYLNHALTNAVECNAVSRMVQTSLSLPYISELHQKEIETSQQRIMLGVLVLLVILGILIAVLLLLRRQMMKDRRLQRKLEEANQVKQVYMRQFLNLCSIYMDKLNQLSKIVIRKISTGKVDELYRLTNSGKFVESQTKEFYETFDNAFLHIYPTFVEEVNKLLRDNEQIVLHEDEKLNNDLRILAFMRLGIEESTRIAQILNYSVYTIYTYRNRLKNRAKNRDTFEREVMAIGL